ncbi:MAG: PQQ-binding-like beta-propeller repeat protein [Armatimonadota bacterium]
MLGLMLAAALASCQPEEPPAEPPAPAHVPPHDPGPITQWPRFRGVQGAGIAQFGDLPVTWDAESGENVSWQTPLPLPGANSAIIWEDRVFVTGADERRREVYCLDAETGRMLWTTPVAEDYAGPVPRTHRMTGFAAPTGTTDGERVYEVFPTGHVVALDFDGRVVWRRHFDMTEDIYGHASSLVLHRGLLYVQIDLGKPDIGRSHMVALQAETGETLWDIHRPVQGSWTTPIVIDTGEREELITSAKPWVIAYDPGTGEELWRVRCVEGDSAPSPIYANGHVYVANIYAELTAIRPGGSGDVTDTHVSWSKPGRLPDITSPLSDGEVVWTLSTDGVLSCYDADDGAVQFAERLGARFRASPSLVGDRVYLISESGDGLIVAAERRLRTLSTGRFTEPVYSSPAFAHGRMYVRGLRHLFCVSGG